MKVFRDSCTENFEKNPGKCMQWSSLLLQLHKYCLQPTIGLKNPQQIIFLKSSERKGYSKISKISKKSLRNGPSFHIITGLQSRSSSCPIHPPMTILKTNFTTNVSCRCFKSFENCWENRFSVVECGGITF